MKRHAIDQGWYGDALPSGHFAVTLFGQGAVLTHDGPWALPGDNLLYTRCSDIGGFRVAGQSHVGRGNLLSTGNGWEVIGASYGVSPVLFMSGGGIIQGEPKYGSQGFRYWDGRPVTGDETYVHPTLPQLWEYTMLGDITVGQGETGAILYYQGVRRLLEDGNCRFIRFTRDGDNLAFAIVKPGYCELIWMTVAEIAQLPEVGLVVAPPPFKDPPLPPMPDPPLPPTEPEVSTFHEYPEIPHEVNRDYPGLIRSDEGGFVDQCAHRCNKRDQAAGLPVGRWGRKRKNDGSLNTDALTYLLDPADVDKKKLVDIIQGDARNPGWDVRPEHEEHGNGTWAPPQSADRDEHEPGDDGDAGDHQDPPPADLAGILQKLAELSAGYADLVARLEKIEKAPAPVVTLPKLRVKGSTSRDLYHAHRIDLEVVAE